MKRVIPKRLFDGFRLFIVSLLLLFSQTGLYAEAPNLALTDIVRKTLQAYFENQPKSYQAFANQFSVPKVYRRQAGVFVTLSANGKSRACWGAFLPKQPDLVKETVFATLGALTKEYRYRPIQKQEWRSLKPQVTIVQRVEPIRSYRELNPYRDGLLVRSGNRAGVILPKEATDAYYEWVMARTKAGIGARDPQQLYRLRVRIEE